MSYIGEYKVGGYYTNEEMMDPVKKARVDAYNRMFQAMLDRLQCREVKGEIPEHFHIYRLDAHLGYTSRVIAAIDQGTSGRFKFEQGKALIGFEDEADMTMFALAYQPHKPIRIETYKE